MKGDTVTELMKLSNSIDSVTKFEMTVRGIRAAYNAFVQHLRNDGISAFEAALGRRPDDLTVGHPGGWGGCTPSGQLPRDPPEGLRVLPRLRTFAMKVIT